MQITTVKSSTKKQHKLLHQRKNRTEVINKHKALVEIEERDFKNNRDILKDKISDRSTKIKKRGACKK